MNLWSKINSTQWLASGDCSFFFDIGPKLIARQSKMQIKTVQESLKLKSCFFKTKQYKTGIFFDQVSTIQRYISQVHCAWIMSINWSVKTKDGILVFLKYLKIFQKKMSLSVSHHIWMRLREFVILIALEWLIYYSVVLFQHQKQQENLKFNKLELRK